MKTIWKYTLELVDDQYIYVPMSAEILTVQVQNGKPQLWAIVNSDEPISERTHIRIHGTGHKLSTTDNMKYISTIQIMEGELVFHVFEII